jgi:Tfp pilus assembly protein PilE
VRTLGIVLPVVFVVGIIAAVARPADVEYTKRAQSGVTR